MAWHQIKMAAHSIRNKPSSTSYFYCIYIIICFRSVNVQTYSLVKIWNNDYTDHYLTKKIEISHDILLARPVANKRRIWRRPCPPFGKSAEVKNDVIPTYELPFTNQVACNIIIYCACVSCIWEKKNVFDSVFCELIHLIHLKELIRSKGMNRESHH